MVKRRSFIRDLKAACKEKEIEYSEIINWIDRHLKDSKPISYYVALGPNPRFPSLLMDILLYTKDSVRGFEVNTNGERVYIIYTQPLNKFTEIITKGWVYMEFIFTQYGAGFALSERVERIDKLRDFVEGVLEQVWRK